MNLRISSKAGDEQFPRSANFLPNHTLCGGITPSFITFVIWDMMFTILEIRIEMRNKFEEFFGFGRFIWWKLLMCLVCSRFVFALAFVQVILVWENNVVIYFQWFHLRQAFKYAVKKLVFVKCIW